MSKPRHIALALDLEEPTGWCRELVAGVGRYAAERGWRCVPDASPLAAAPGTWDGVIGPSSRSFATRCVAAGLPYVGVTWSVRAMRMARVVEDRHVAGRLAAQHLAGRGYCQFAYLGVEQDIATRLMELAYVATLRRYPGDVHSLLLPFDHWPTLVPRGRRDRWERLRKGVAAWVERLTPPVGVLVARDALAVCLADLVCRMGLRVPDDVGIVGTGNDAGLCGLTVPPLSSVEFAYDTVGYRAAALLDRIIDRGLAPGTQFVRLEKVAPTLVPRGSTDRWYEDDPVLCDAMGFIGAHSHEPIRVGDVAAAVGVSARVLLRRFRRIRESTVAGEITAMRLRRARDLLAGTDAPVAAVARLCGFAGARRLAALFRQHEGCTPTAWRQRVRSEPPARQATMAKVKRLLVGTDRSVAEIARACGYRSARRLAQAFREAEYLTPIMYRSIYRPRRTAPAAPPPVEIVFIGPDGQPEPEPDEGTTDAPIAASRSQTRKAKTKPKD